MTISVSNWTRTRPVMSCVLRERLAMPRFFSFAMLTLGLLSSLAVQAAADDWVLPPIHVYKAPG